MDENGNGINLISAGQPRLFLPIFLPLLAAGVIIVCVLLSVRLIKQQIKLHNSITLVELKSSKFFYWTLAALTFSAFVFCVIRAAVSEWATPEFMLNVFGMEPALTTLCYVILALMMLALFAVMLILSISRCAVVDKGVYTLIQYIDWYHIYGYHFEEKTNKVMVTRSKTGFMSIEGVTPPLKCSPKDVEKLKFILNKNKNKFLSNKYNES